MDSLRPFLLFDGNCREALQFYQRCLESDTSCELHFQTLAETPDASQFPESLHPYIVHAVLRTDSFALLATDLIPDNGLKRGNNVSLALECKDPVELQRMYINLSEKGIADLPPNITAQDTYSGMLTDRYGHQWWLYTRKTTNSVPR